MFNKVKPFVVVFLALSGLAILGFSQAWAQPPKAQEIIFGADQDIKVQFEPNGDVKAVYFLDCVNGEGCCDTAKPLCWVEDKEAEPGYICTCVGSDCTDNLDENISLANETDRIVDCHAMTNSGPRSTGCPLYGSRSYTYGGMVYSR
jgi:hypothetical protein